MFGDTLGCKHPAIANHQAATASGNGHFLKDIEAQKYIVQGQIRIQSTSPDLVYCIPVTEIREFAQPSVVARIEPTL